MINSKHMEELEMLGFGADIDALESYVADLQNAAADGEPLVQDPIYDKHRSLLAILKPDSEVLKRNWEKDSTDELQDYDELLKQYGMRSIRTCVDRVDVEKFLYTVLSDRSDIDVCTSFKLNGHACRIVYKNGDLVSATTRGRYKKGRNITRHLRRIVGEHNEYLEGYDLVEIRGELIVTYDDFENTLRYNCKTPLSSVTSLVRDSASDEEIDMLHFVAYKMIIKDCDLFETLSEEFEHLSIIGFEVPNYDVYTISGYSDIENILKDFEDKKINKEIPFDTDGIVMAVNDNYEFYSLGLDGNAHNGNIAVKMGIWECNMYTSTIVDIVWEHGKSWFTPKAVIEPVVTVTGATVRVVPIYNVGVMNKLKLIPGNTIHFRFGGETGVQLLTPEGLSVTMI